MPTHYHIYGNSGTGGAVDHSTILATVTGTSWESPALALGSRWTFAVRAFDEASGLEESNIDASVSIVIDGSGLDVTDLPGPPQAVTARATSSGIARIDWAYPAPRSRAKRPMGFHLYRGAPTPDFSEVAATVVYRDAPSFAAAISGLEGGVTYQVAVRAFNSTGEEANPLTASVTAKESGPSAVDDLTSTLTPLG